MIYLLSFLTVLLLILIYVIEKDVISPSFIFCLVFMIAEFNVISNVTKLGVKFRVDTVLVVIFGIFMFFIGTILANLVPKCVGKRKKNIRTLDLTMSKQVFLCIFNIVSIIYILKNVYILVVQRAGYVGGILGSLSVFAEVSKFQSIDMKLDTVSTLLTALCEAEAYIFGYIIASKLVKKEKIEIITLICFITSFLSTFCQGSRGGVFIIIASVFCFIIIYRKEKGIKIIGLKLIFKLIGVIILAIVAFQIIGTMTGKMWDVSVYEYFSVYLGDPLINFDTKLSNGIERTKISGQASFGGLIKNIFGKLGIYVPKYGALGEFQYYGNHNLGNVYTIFAYLIADFGILGCWIACFIIGIIVEFIYIRTIKNKKNNDEFMTILCGYIMSSVGFSFFSNKICENVTIYHIYMFLFVFIIINFLTKKGDKYSIVQINGGEYEID